MTNDAYAPYDHLDKHIAPGELHSPAASAMLDDLLAKIVRLGDDKFHCAAIDLLEETSQFYGGDVDFDQVARNRVEHVIDILRPYATPECDESDFVHELIGHAGSADDDSYND